MKNTLILCLIFLASCTGGNESITGKVPSDYIPFALMVIGALSFAYGYFFSKGSKDTFHKIFRWCGIIVAAFGVFYIWGA